ncbi:threonine synthase [Thermogymnomonas acidicola]|uniref:Threonine synthase n=1 Tax=Thermogymnomonas acidicola TaxID=399579 RepID=A0AA37BSD8_9ARCH|nr:pyridoxal-phosphate dependent enzyme [Thermogymnomonas acidicola]GGM78134.1 threonine synthase [Thermogymnomonas acidicola]
MECRVFCLGCGRERHGLEARCSHCGSPFDIEVSGKYSDRLQDNFPYVSRWISLGEVQTPIVSAGGADFKLDYLSPTFSYKDRGARALVSFLRGRMDHGTINEDSSGNAGAAIAAYGSAAGFRVRIFTGSRAREEKIRQIESYGAEVVRVEGSREDVQRAAMGADGVYASHVLMPEFRDGIRTLAYEVFQQYSGSMPDRIFVPVSAGTLLLGLHRGLRHLLESGEIGSMPEIVGVQPEKVSPICHILEGRPYEPPVDGQSVADALVTQKPVLGVQVAEAVRQTGGTCVMVSDEEIMSAHAELSRAGLFCEVSSATVYAAYKKRKWQGRSLLVLTGAGLKTVMGY